MPSRWIAVLLLGALPYVWRAGLGLAWSATEDAELSRFLAPGAALALWLLAIHAVSLAAGSFHVGLFAGTILVTAMGVWHGGARFWEQRSAQRGGPDSPPSRPIDRRVWIGAAAAVGILVFPEIYYSKHDECLVTGHVSIPAEMQNGIYPPHHLTFSNYELRYHYGIDLLDAVASTLLGRVDVHATVHVVALLLWGYTFSLCWLLGERLIGGKYAGPVTAACVLFAGGAPYLCAANPPSAIDYYTSICKEGGTWITPPFVSNFLQHPWSLGTPLFAAILLLLTHSTSGEPRPAGWALLSALAASLSFAQVVLFVCFVPSFAAAYAAQKREGFGRRLARGAVWAAAMAVVARLLHGVFAPVAEPAAAGAVWHPFWVDASAAEWLRWHAAALGALIPLGAAGFFIVKRHRWLLGLMATGGLLIRDTLTYKPSWNIVKFSMVSQIALAILAAAAIAAAIAREGWVWRVAGVGGLALCTFFGFSWPVALTVHRPPSDCLPPGLSSADRSAVDFLRSRIGAGEGVFRSEHAEAYAIYGGLPQQTMDWGARSFGFSDDLYERRRRLLANPDDLDELRGQGFRWVVVAPSDAARMGAATERWIRESKADLAAEFPPLRVIRLR